MKRVWQIIQQKNVVVIKANGKFKENDTFIHILKIASSFLIIWIYPAWARSGARFPFHMMGVKINRRKKKMQTNVVREMNKPFEVIALHRMWWIELKMNPHQNRHRPGVIRIVCFSLSFSFFLNGIGEECEKLNSYSNLYHTNLFWSSKDRQPSFWKE